MKRINLTEEILTLHEQEYVSAIDREATEEEDKYGIDDAVLTKARSLIAMAEARMMPQRSNVVTADFGQGQKTSSTSVPDNVVQFEPFGEFELLAAASKDTNTLWYEQIITVGAIDGRGGCLLEINPYGENPSDVAITLSAKLGSEALLNQMLLKFAGKDVNVEISFEGNPILTAELYVTPEATMADGLGTIKQIDKPDTTKEKLKIGFSIKK
jgi:hypothetical protein